MRILAVVAHPDDWEVGASGLLACLASDEHEIETIVATSARTGKKLSDRDAATVREEESKRAHALIGATPTFLRYETGSLSDDPPTRARFSELFYERSPDAVFTMWPVDVHPDHRAVGSLTMNHFLQKGCNTELFCFEVRAGTTEPYPQTLHFVPTHYHPFYDPILAKKKEVLFCHKSQNPMGLWVSNKGLWAARSEELALSDYPSFYPFAEAFVRLTRTGEAPPWLAEWLLTTPQEEMLPLGPRYKETL